MPGKDDHLIERRIDGQELLKGNFLHVFRDTVLLPDGKRATREYIVHRLLETCWVDIPDAISCPTGSMAGAREPINRRLPPHPDKGRSIRK